ncbi:glycosyltransferase family 2 protein [Lichtheimia corymbifera JMRC:FSU:9682]|uniref:Glycosyltransferase family 2 protein n=1 Tax=Lichtheimia corymbifera JMRC:FSU:9682 TaxID=1263082 RepID=A0A068RY55_9FUNG|nr:glycosyltransferase family 2 protein [Lichtheimia corymbifera JMRC:FSU:9682]
MLYLTNDVGLLPFFLPLGVIGFYRYLWYLIRIIAWLTYKPRRPRAEPTYRPEHDVTIIVPTIDAGEEFKIAARSWLACNPKEIIIITETSMREPLQELANEVDPARIRVLTVPKANKRLQMVAGVNATNTEILVFADDDAIWKPTMLDYILACFEDLKMGGVGTSQTVHAVNPNGHQTLWEILAGFRLTSRNIEIAASTHIDGGICCLSGRTAAYRTLILKDPAFQYCFTNDLWLGKYPLNSGDDKFLTRWMCSHGWNTYAQQVLRWTRNTWRSDFRSLFTERFIWTRHPYVAFTMVDKIFNPLTLLAGPILVGVFCSLQEKNAGPSNPPLPGWNIAVSYIVWLLLTRFIKLIPHFIKRPLDIWVLPFWLIFNYYFAIMKIYALFTLHVTAWGTRTFTNGEGLGAPMETDEKNNNNTSHNITIQQHNHDEEQGIHRVEMKDMSHSQLANHMH